MNRLFQSFQLDRAVIVFTAVGALSCARGDDDSVAIVIMGQHGLEVGDSVTLTVATEHGTDHSYVWESLDNTVAEVDAAGTVTALAPGETAIIATGEDTRASAEHTIVVTDPTAETPSDVPPEDGGVPYYDEWLMSAHADATAEAFTHWNEEGEIPATCAKCHSQAGFRDFIGDDGSEVGTVNQAAPTGSTVDCETCHNDAASQLDTVTFPSGVVVTGLGPEARCMTCHQGRGSTDSVNEAIAEAGVADDEVSEALSFQNIHYYPAAATLFAGQVRGGYQYPDHVYDRRFRHVPNFNVCVECHDPHSTQVRFDACSTCHEGAIDNVEARGIRMIASFNVDYDGDQDTEEGIFYEVEGLTEKLYLAIQRYASEVAEQPVCYSPTTYPYWFKSQTGAFSECTSEDTAGADSGFVSWTPRLLRATYNYQMARKDPGAYAHNGRYIIKLLHDSVVDLNGAIGNPVDMIRADRDAPGHFNGASEAARHWDEDEAVSASCSQCHSGASGFRFYIEYGVGLEVPETANGLECYTCHETFAPDYEVVAVDSTRYPSNITLAHDGFDNVCATCHSGRTAKSSIDAAIAADNLGFRNVHNAPAAAVRNGSTSRMGYEYDDKIYSGFLVHDSRTQCTGCHDPVATNHTFKVEDAWDAVCTTCHFDQTGPRDVRIAHLQDYNGNGDVSETLAEELEVLSTELLAAISGFAADPVCYSPDVYPYWFVAQSAPVNGLCGSEDTTYDSQFTEWTPELMKATHNYQLYAKDHGAYAHNFEYIAQLLIDSIEDLGGAVGNFYRP
jgi:predicted CXXCH cytochrome family protein